MKWRWAIRTVKAVVRLQLEWSRLGALCNLKQATLVQRRHFSALGMWLQQTWIRSLMDGMKRRKGRKYRSYKGLLPPAEGQLGKPRLWMLYQLPQVVPTGLP